MWTMTSKYHVTSFFTTWNWRSVCRQAGLFLKTRKDIIYIVKVLSSIKEYKASDPIGELYYQMTLTIQTRKDIIHIAKYFLAHPKSKASDPIDKFYYQMNLILQMVVEQWKIGCYKQLIVGLTSALSVPGMEHLTCSNSTFKVFTPSKPTSHPHH
jgi:hypothetical protein